MTRSNARAVELTSDDFVRFEDFRPTSFDQRGLGVEDDRADWLVVPGFASHPKMGDDLLTESNNAAFAAALLAADPECNDHETHLFGHWATDFEITVVRPGRAAHHTAAECVCAVADYPVLDESDYSNREYAEQHRCIADGLSCLTVLDADGEELVTDAPPAERDPADPIATYLSHQIWEHMWNDGQPWRCLEETGQPGGGGPDREDCERALKEMGYTYDDSECVWRGSDDELGQGDVELTSD